MRSRRDYVGEWRVPLDVFRLSQAIGVTLGLPHMVQEGSCLAEHQDRRDDLTETPPMNCPRLFVIRVAPILQRIPEARVHEPHRRCS